MLSLFVFSPLGLRDQAAEHRYARSAGARRPPEDDQGLRNKHTHTHTHKHTPLKADHPEMHEAFLKMILCCSMLWSADQGKYIYIYI